MLVDIRKYVAVDEYQEAEIETLELYRDIKTHHGVNVVKVDIELDIGDIYEFNLDRYNEYYDHYVVLKKLEDNIYLLSMCSDEGLCEFGPFSVKGGRINCDIQQKYGINFDEFKNKSIKYDDNRFYLDESVDLIARLIDLRRENEEYKKKHPDQKKATWALFAYQFNQLIDEFMEYCPDELLCKIETTIGWINKE